MKEELTKFIDYGWLLFPIVWAVMSIVYMIYDLKFSPFSMASVVFCWIVDRARNEHVA